MQNGSRDSAVFQPQLLVRNHGENVEQQFGQADRGERCLLAKVLHEWIETLESFLILIFLDRQIIRSPMGKSSRRRSSFGIGKMIGRRSGAFDIGKMMGKVGRKVLAPIRELHRGGSYGGYLNSPTAKKRRSGNYMAELVEFKDKRENFSVTFQAQEMSEDISQGELYCIK